MFKIIRSAAFPAQFHWQCVEVSAMTGLPQETIIGLPDTVLKESRTRINQPFNLQALIFQPILCYESTNGYP